MPAASPVDRYQPSFLRFPVQNSRTGFKPYYIPVILVVPLTRNQNGTHLLNTGVFNLKYYIVDAPDPAKVSGQEHKGVLIPNLSQFVLDIDNNEFQNTRIDITGHQYFDSQGILKDTIQEGDFFQYTSIRGNITSLVPYFPDADYFDLSIFTIDVEDLPRPNRYLFIWECQYFTRLTPNINFDPSINSVCISDVIGTSRSQMLVAHPGEVHEEMFEKTPDLYFDNNKFTLSDDPLLELYRPYADILQDIFDEQGFLNGINNIDKIPAQLIPYLSYLIGWDLPNFPGVTDNIRRSILRHATRLQKLKGTKKAITELFEMFGYSIELINLWYSSDGLAFVQPGEKTVGDNITVTPTCRTEPLLFDYAESGYAQNQIPLLFKPLNNIQIYVFTVDVTSDAYQLLLSNESSSTSECEIALNDSLIAPNWIDDVLQDSSVSHTYLTLINGVVTSASSLGVESPLANKTGVSFDKRTNLLSLTLDHYVQLSANQRLFAFAVYGYNKLDVPDRLSNLRSNRFAVNILLKDGQTPTPSTLEFLINFIFKLKSFHSLLHKISYDLTFDTVYNVSDFCTSQTEDVCANQNSTPNQLQQGTVASLVEEFEAWKNLDGRCNTVENTDLLNIPPTLPVGDSCQFTQYGQDRVVSSGGCDNTEGDREKFCGLAALPPSNCFKGRVENEVETTISIPLCEIVRTIPCGLSLGSGSYWLYPTNIKTLMLDGFGSIKGQRIGFLSVLAARYGHPLPQSLHYTNLPYFVPAQFKPNNFLAYRRPSLEITKTNLDFPGHRYVNMSKLKNDFTHPTWTARPWDNAYDDLDAQIVPDTNGDTKLVFNVKPIVYKSNGLTPDVSSLGYHEDRSFKVTHKIYLKSDSLHPAITLDPRVTLTTDSFIETDTPIFDSYNGLCKKDFIYGYPSSQGRLDVSYPSSGTDSLLDLLDLPFHGTDPINVLFTLGSMILVDKSDKFYDSKAYRLDCCCSKYACSGSEDVTVPTLITNIDTCENDNYKLPDGSYDWNMDQIDIEPKIVLNEKRGIGSYRLDRQIPSMISLCTSLGCDIEIGLSGVINYKDSYGVIYDGAWTRTGNVLTVNLETRSPNVWGQKPEGYLDKGKVFRKGIITTSQQVVKILDDGYELVKSISTQRVDFFQTNTKCGDLNFVDNFCYHLDNSMQDYVETSVDSGSRWCDVGEDIVWPNLEVDSAGNVIMDIGSSEDVFHFIDIWNK